MKTKFDTKQTEALNKDNEKNTRNAGRKRISKTMELSNRKLTLYFDDVEFKAFLKYKEANNFKSNSSCLKSLMYKAGFFG